MASYIEDMECKYEPLPKQSSNSIPNSKDETYKCDICDRIFIGSYQWGLHIRSHKHRKMLEKKKKNENKVKIVGEEVQNK